jgi:hypothetical protein
MPLRYKPWERKSLDALMMGVQSGMPGTQAYGVYSDIYGGALDRMYDRVARRREEEQLRQQNEQQAMMGLGSSLTEAALGGVPAEGLEALAGIQTSTNPYLTQPQGLDQLLQQAGTLSSSVGVGEQSPFFDEEDAAMIRQAVEQAWARGLQDEQQIENYIMGSLGEAGAAAAPFITEIVQNTVSRLRQTSGTQGPSNIPGTIGSFVGTALGGGLMNPLTAGLGSSAGRFVGEQVGGNIGLGGRFAESEGLERLLRSVLG